MDRPNLDAQEDLQNVLFPVFIFVQVCTSSAYRFWSLRGVCLLQSGLINEIRNSLGTVEASPATHPEKLSMMLQVNLVFF